MARGRRHFVVSLPALLGASLVVVYVFGILNAAGAFAKAQIPQTALRLLSVEQLLVRGISILAEPGVAVIIPLLGASVVVFEFAQRATKPPISPARRARLNRMSKRFGGTYLVFLLGGLLILPWEASLSFVPVVIAPLMMVMASKRGTGHKINLRRLNVFFMASILVALLLGSYLLPLPQPTAEVIPIDSSRLNGVLVTHVDAVWYIWQKKHGEVVAISDSRAEHVNLTYPGETNGPSAASLFIHLVS